MDWIKSFFDNSYSYKYIPYQTREVAFVISRSSMLSWLGEEYYSGNNEAVGAYRALEPYYTYIRYSYICYPVDDEEVYLELDISTKNGTKIYKIPLIHTKDKWMVKNYRK